MSRVLCLLLLLALAGVGHGQLRKLARPAGESDDAPQCLSLPKRFGVLKAKGDVSRDQAMSIARLQFAAENVEASFGPDRLTKQQQIFAEGLISRVRKGDNIDELPAGSGLKKTVYQASDDITHTVWKAEGATASVNQTDNQVTTEQDCWPCDEVCYEEWLCAGAYCYYEWVCWCDC
ncbi:unnamed protein product [Vitrella brassicaformis CCMP3155]|uniref:Uncharacterized protein n=1 Tax=Vitrella brassicaformis (strain CCMP3155) TaxID=1169540 RepID=A0A0G4ECD7_VITBC|nr:unnamed protein product [Vitrella brassicaformis CCMP3155]|eukprot:CEL93010.1 unnamed protein product [Vitrella brassicaformis CCMP3155]